MPIALKVSIEHVIIIYCIIFINQVQGNRLDNLVLTIHYTVKPLKASKLHL